MKDLHNIRYVKAVTVILGRRCNGKCSYCVQSNFLNTIPDMELNEDIIDFLVSLSNVPRQNKKDKLQILLYGGEPLIYWNKLQKLISAIWNDPETNTANIYFQMFTNGVMLTEEMVNFFNLYNVKVVLSYDGPDESTRPVRLDPEKIPLFLKIRNRRISFVLSYENMDFFSSMLYLKQKFLYTDIDFAICTYDGKSLGLPPFYVNKVFEKNFSNLVQYYRTYPIDHFLSVILLRLNKQQPLIENNQGYFLSVDLSGNLYGFSDLEESKVGTIYADCFQKLCEYRMGLYNEKCQKCECNFFCRKHFSEKAYATCNLVKAMYAGYSKYKFEFLEIASRTENQEFFEQRYNENLLEKLNEENI